MREATLEMTYDLDQNHDVINVNETNQLLVNHDWLSGIDLPNPRSCNFNKTVVSQFLYCTVVQTCQSKVCLH